MARMTRDARTLALAKRTLTRRFPLGRVRATRKALAALEAAGNDYATLVERHAACEWQGTPPAEVIENREALKGRGSILTTHRLADGSALWIGTEDDRSMTLLFVPGEL